jgi:hypothetical protein
MKLKDKNFEIKKKWLLSREIIMRSNQKNIRNNIYIFKNTFYDFYSSNGDCHKNNDFD